MAWARKTLGGQCCVPDCGKKRGLEFDHIDPGGKEANISRIWSRPMPVFAREVLKCQLLCHEHHIQKHSGRLDTSFEVGDLESGAENDFQ